MARIAVALRLGIFALASLVPGVALADPVRGRVVDVKGVPVRGAIVSIEGTVLTATTDDAGFFSIDNASAGAGVIVTKPGYTLGYATGEQALPDIILVDEAQAETITVHGERPPTSQGAQRLSRDELQHLPGTGGDLMQTLSAMPGVASTILPLGQSGVVIRGSSPQDSKVLVDEFEVPALYHSLGFRSIAREEAIDSLDYIPGGFDAAFGRATSGIISLTTRAGDDAPRGELDTSTGDVGLLAQDHIGNFRYMVAARRSVIDLLLPLVIPDDADLHLTTVPRYYDEQVRLDYKISPRWDARLSSIGSDDALAIYTDRAQNPDQFFSQSTRFIRVIGAALFHDGPWSAKLALSGIAIDSDLEVGAFQHVRISSPAITARAEGTRAFDTLGFLTIRVGGEAVHTRNTIDVASPQEQREGENAGAQDPNDTSLSFRGRVITDDLAAWAVASVVLHPRIRLSAGLRVDNYRRGGDTAIQPRGDISLQMTQRLVARFSAGAYSRPPEYNSELVAPPLSSERATQLIAGVTYEIIDGARVQASIYDTARSDLITRDTMTGQLSNAGKGTTYGGEIAGTFRRGPWFGWLAYSYSHSTRTDQPGGASRLFDYDQPHNLELLGSYRLGGWTFGARFRVLSGLPVTPVTGSIFDSDRNLYTPIYGPVNSDRAELHHQLDLRVERKSVWHGIQLTRYVDVQNVYLNQSVVTYFYNYDYTQRAALRWLPILPVVGLRAEI